MNKFISSHELWSLSLSIQDTEDYLLVDELAMICQNDFMYKIIFSYISTGVLLEEEREKLIGYYVLYYSEDVDDE